MQAILNSMYHKPTIGHENRRGTSEELKGFSSVGREECEVKMSKIYYAHMHEIVIELKTRKNGCLDKTNHWVWAAECPGILPWYRPHYKANMPL